MDHIFYFPRQKRLRERSTVLCYTYNGCLVKMCCEISFEQLYLPTYETKKQQLLFF
jgi:hypothetical protein